ncbi:putative iron-regulated protein [Lewinella marina]|uniref:Iron-regulated protein n=1 Tax=Neolewinella marina TaxID=438751 RepID=A0A2G0CFT2_9BACT|nr:ChaN family lipoprotein [Neolewinella marina]NJB85532.1 putative iron-regulated protein [Neolewinella marina]PHK98780.1 iron-regulated protein [Neolewinella marina]
MRFTVTFLLIMFSAIVVGQKNPAYQLFNESGRKVHFGKMMKELREADIILFGEYHDNPIAHWMELEIIDGLGKYSLGMEMFETDEQERLDEFMNGQITLEELDSLTGGVWPNFKTDYLPLLQAARADSSKVYATNTPRRFARMVFQRGFVVLRSLDEADRAYLPPLLPPYDPELPGYKAMRVQGHGSGHSGENFPKAQAIKDATMAWFIVKNAEPGVPFVHVNGSYHSDNFEGISWYLRQYKPQLKVMTITTLEQPEIDELRPESVGKANFTLLVPSNMTKTY